VYVTRCSGDALNMCVERPYSDTFPEDRDLAKPLIQLDLLEPGTHLAAIRDKNVRMTQTQLRDFNEIEVALL